MKNAHDVGKDFLVMGDIMDAQLQTHEGRKIGRVADIVGEWHEDGSLELTHIVTGPEALIGRIDPRLRPLAHLLFRGRFEHRIPLSEVETFGATLRLRGTADDYAVGQSERWLATHILRWIPGGKG